MGVLACGCKGRCVVRGSGGNDLTAQEGSHTLTKQP